jgi:hypothetical protein
MAKAYFSTVIDVTTRRVWDEFACSTTTYGRASQRRPRLKMAVAATRSAAFALNILRLPKLP